MSDVRLLDAAEVSASLAAESEPCAAEANVASEPSEASRDRSWLELLLTRPSTRLASNLRTEWAVIRAGDVLMPTTINDADYENTYVCSPYAACVLYPQSEIDKLPGRVLPAALRGFVRALGPPLRAARINQVACVNNWMLSTNLYAKFDPAHATAITRLLVERFPRHAIMFRSLNETTNGPLLRRLTEAGYLLAPSRQVYFFDGASGEFLRRPNVRWDRRLLATTPYRVVRGDPPGLGADDSARIEQLYRLLYVEKYSRHNPQFTAEMFDECRRRRLWTFWGLRDASGRLDGVLGAFVRDGVMTVPLVGYDTALPQRTGLYRMLMALALGEAAERRWLLNLSSGAAEFKRLRGGTPCLEYSAVYCRHLPVARRAAWQGLAGLLRNVGAPILRKYRL